MKAKRWIKRIFKWLFGLIIGSVLLISGALYFFHDEIVALVIGEMNKHLKAKVEVSKVDITFWSTFPNVALDFHNVFVPDALPGATRKDTLLYTELLRLRFDPVDIWNEDYHVESIDVSPGTLQLKINKEGKVNYDIVRAKESTGTSKFELMLEAIHVEGMRFCYSNELQEQLYAATVNNLDLNGKFTEKRFDLHTEAAFRINNLQNGKIPFVVNQPATTVVDIHVDQEKQTVSLPNGVVHLAGLPFQVKVLVDSTSVHAAVKAERLLLEDVANHLAVREVNDVKRYKGSGTASFRLNFDSKLGADAYPEIDCFFNIRNGRLTEPEQHLSLRDIQLDGRYSTLEGKGYEFLNLREVSFASAGGPFAGDLSIRHFSAPTYKGKAKGSINLAVIHSLFKLPKIETLTGTVDVNTQFALSTVPEGIAIDDGSGTAVMNDVHLQLQHDHRKFEKINGKMILSQHQAVLERLSVLLGHSDLVLDGHFDQIDGFLQDKSNLQIEVVARSKHIDLADFNSNEVAAAGASADVPREWLLPTMIAGLVRMEVGSLKLEDHIFSGLRGNMTVGRRSITIDQLYGRNAEAAVHGSLAVVERSPEYFEMATSLTSDNIYFKPLFREWHNFEQDVITADNISGKAEVDLDFKAPFDMRKGVIKNAIMAQIQLKVTNGNLKNVGAFKDLTASLNTPKTRLVLKKNEIAALDGKLGNISFETLENTIYIKNSKLLIPSMLIHSNAIDITTEGTHTFDNDIDYKFAFRFRELKVLKDESEFGEVTDDGTGIRMYVRMYGPLDNPTIVWDGQARKDQARENREAAKDEAISILKTEFGFRKNDTTVKAYVPKKVQHEELRMDFGTKEDEVVPVKEEQKTNKLLNSFKEKTRKMKEEQQKRKEDEFTIDP